FMIGGLAGANGGKKGAPGVGHAAAEGVEIEAEASRFTKQAAGEIVERKAAGRRLFEEALRDQVAQHAVQRIAIGAGGGGEIADFGMAGFDMIGDAKRGGDVY